MSLEIVRRIRGNVHGTIDVSRLEDAVLKHPYLQRLRRIRQLAFLHYVFPGATHSRFEHSLGVMQLAGNAWAKLQVNQQRLGESVARIADFAALERQPPGGLCHGLITPTITMQDQIFESDYNLQVLRLAGLLHDIGHPPFSHSGERFLPTWTQVLESNQESPQYLLDWLTTKIEQLVSKGKDPSKVHVRHEVYSLLLVERTLTETYDKNPDLQLVVDPRDVVAVIAPEIEPEDNSPIRSNGVFKMLHELVSGELDIDRMDYLLRDSRECGVVYGIFDAGRILDGLCIYQDPEDKCLHIGISHTGLAAFEDYLRARQSMYLQVYFHKTAASAEAMMQHLARRLGGWQLPAAVEKYARVDEYNIGPALEQAASECDQDMYQTREFDRLVRDLLYDRDLWKLAFESKHRADDRVAKERYDAVKAAFVEAEITFEEVSSRTSLTRFSPRAESERSNNYLRLIVKDGSQIPRVVPVEDHASVVQDNEPVAMQRIYVSGEDDAVLARVQEILRI